jgi:competence protein CoiA
MLSAKRKPDGHIVTAYFESRASGPYVCQECNEEVTLKAGNSRINHFAHVNPITCKFSTGETEPHRRCKMEIFEELRKTLGVRSAALERPLGSVRPDVSAFINGVAVAIEVQISSLSLDTIMHRTIQYAQKGIYVLWLLQWTPELDENALRSAPLGKMGPRGIFRSRLLLGPGTNRRQLPFRPDFQNHP